jgi:hypothetical protein
MLYYDFLLIRLLVSIKLSFFRIKKSKDPMSYNVSAICGRLDNDFKVY